MAKLNALSRFSCSWYAFFKISIISLLVGLLIGCPANVSKQLDFDEAKSSQYYLSQYTAASGNQKIDWQLLAIRSLIIEGNTQQARQLINQLPSDLNKTQQKESLLLQGELAVKNKLNFDINQLTFADLTEGQKIRYYTIKIGLDGQKGDVNSQIRDYIELEKYGTTEQRHQAINDTWNFLSTLDDSSISSVLVYANESVLQGWIDLAYSYRNNSNIYAIEDGDDAEAIAKKEESSLNLIKNAVKEWQMQYSTHPAALYLPRNIYGEKYRLPDDASQKTIALLLPLSGPSKVFGDAIRLGYSDAARFYSQELQQNLYVYDTNSNSLDVLVKQAQQQGAELIVGPLLKQDVLTIMKLAPSMPVLALNKIDSTDFTGNYPEQICFFALSPENEAMDAANHIYSQRKKIPLLIVPKSDLGDRIVNSFAAQWRSIDPASNGVYVQYFDSENALSTKMNSGIGIELEGSLIADSKFSSNESTSSNHFLTDFSTSDSVMTAQSDTETPQFDSIYIYASHSELTLIKSMLEMASNKIEVDENGQEVVDKKGNKVAIKKIIPALYSSSRSHIADTTQDFRYDMDRMQFSDIPLIVNQNQLVEELPSYIKNDYSLVRLYAMGVDAWRLANRFSQLKPYQIDVLDGMTGQLSVAQQCEVTRTFTWLQYRNGEDTVVQ